MVDVPVDEALTDIVTKYRNVVINLECDGKAYWMKLIVEVWPIQRVDQWVDWITNPPSGEEVPNTDRIISMLPGTKKNNGRQDLVIKSRGKPVKALKDLLRKIFNLKVSLVFFYLPLTI